MLVLFSQRNVRLQRRPPETARTAKWYVGDTLHLAAWGVQRCYLQMKRGQERGDLGGLSQLDLTERLGPLGYILLVSWLVKSTTAMQHITHLLSYPMHHDCPTQPCFHTFTMRVKACTHGCLWATSVISLSIHTLGLGQKWDENKHSVNMLSGFLIKEHRDTSGETNVKPTDE